MKTFLCISSTDLTKTRTFRPDMFLPCPLHVTMENWSLPSSSPARRWEPIPQSKAVHWITILESCSTSASALRTSRSKSMAFCQAPCATVTRPPQPGPPHFFSPSSVLQLGPPHSVSEHEAPGGVPQVCNKWGSRHQPSEGESVARHSCAGPGWPQRACRWSSARVLGNTVFGERSVELRNKLPYSLPRKQFMMLHQCLLPQWTGMSSGRCVGCKHYLMWGWNLPIGEPENASPLS